MNVIIDGVEYAPVEKKVDQEREKAVDAMFDIISLGEVYRSDLEAIYDNGYRKTGEEVSKDEIEDFFRYTKGWDINNLMEHYTVFKKLES